MVFNFRHSFAKQKFEYTRGYLFLKTINRDIKSNPVFEFYCVPHQSLVFSDLNIKGYIVEPSSRSCGWSEDRGLVPLPKRSRILGGATRCWSWASADLSSQFSVTQPTSGLAKKGWTLFSRLFLVPASADFLSISNKWFSPAVVRSLSTSSTQLDCVSVSFSFWLYAQTSRSTALTSTWNTWSRWIVKSTNKKTKFVVISYNSYTFCVQISTHTPLPVPQLPSHSSLEKHYNPQEGHPGRLPFQCPQDELFFELSTIVRTNTHISNIFITLNCLCYHPVPSCEYKTPYWAMVLGYTRQRWTFFLGGGSWWNRQAL